MHQPQKFRLKLLIFSLLFNQIICDTRSIKTTSSIQFKEEGEVTDTKGTTALSSKTSQNLSASESDRRSSFSSSNPSKSNKASSFCASESDKSDQQRNQNKPFTNLSTQTQKSGNSISKTTVIKSEAEINDWLDEVLCCSTEDLLLNPNFANPLQIFTSQSVKKKINNTNAITLKKLASKDSVSIEDFSSQLQNNIKSLIEDIQIFINTLNNSENLKQLSDDAIDKLPQIKSEKELSAFLEKALQQKNLNPKVKLLIKQTIYLLKFNTEFTKLEKISESTSPSHADLLVLQALLKKIDFNLLPTHISNQILAILIMTHDLLAGFFLQTIFNAETENNKKHSGFMEFFKKKFTPLTATGLVSLKNSSLFFNIQFDQNLPLDKYESSLQNWYMTSIRLPEIIHKMSSEEKKKTVLLLHLQKDLVLMFLQTFKHNLQYKKTLTLRDHDHLSALLYRLQLTTTILDLVDISSIKAMTSPKNIEDIKFNFKAYKNSLIYSKRNAYTPNATFWKNKKKVDLGALDLLLAEKSHHSLKYLSEFFLSHFSKCRSFISKNMKDPKENEYYNPFLLSIFAAEKKSKE